MKILGIETSCDESAAAVVEDGRFALSNVIASQAGLHARYGGVVPEVASRKHLESLLSVIEAALGEARCTWDDLAAVAFTVGPGLSGALLVGVNTAKAVAVDEVSARLDVLDGDSLSVAGLPAELGSAPNTGGDQPDADGASPNGQEALP